MPLRSRKWIWVSLTLTLVLGISLGILLDELVLGGERDSRRGESSRQSRTERFKAKLENELDLSREQKEELEKALASSNERARAFWKETRSAYSELRKEFRQEIRALLTPEQQKRFDEMMAREDARRKKRKKER